MCLLEYSSMSTELWVEKYRPKTFDDFVWSDETIRHKAEEWVQSGALPHLLLEGRAGTGKTSLSELFMIALDIPESDILRIKASRERGVEVIQERIGSFVNSWAMGPSGIKYILLDEIDAISPHAQKMLRNDMETYSDVTRFIATCNYLNKILGPVQSRFQTVSFQTLGRDDFTVRAATVLVEEGVEFEIDILENFVERTYPDLRKCIGLLQLKTVGGKLGTPAATDKAAKDYLLDFIDLFRKGQHVAARKLIVSQAQPEEYHELFRYFYEHLDLFGNTQDQQDHALKAIRTGIVNHALVYDVEINLAATMVELCQITLTV